MEYNPDFHLACTKIFLCVLRCRQRNGHWKDLHRLAAQQVFHGIVLLRFAAEPKVKADQGAGHQHATEQRVVENRKVHLPHCGGS